MEVLTFDIGENLVGVLDVNTGEYTSYRGDEKVDGARRVIACEGIIVSFNGTCCDLPSLVRILGLKEETPDLKGDHCDMLEIASEDRWPTSPGGTPIWGTNLRATYKHYFGDDVTKPPASASGDHEEGNWLDCWMVAELWKKLCPEEFNEDVGATV